jgi:hypothetical protein
VLKREQRFYSVYMEMISAITGRRQVWVAGPYSPAGAFQLAKGWARLNTYKLAGPVTVRIVSCPRLHV